MSQLGMGKIAVLLVNGVDFSRGDKIMILTEEQQPLAWHYLSAKPMRVNRGEVTTVESYNSMMEQYEELFEKENKGEEENE